MISAPWIPAPSRAGADELERAVLRTVAYGDVFDYPVRDLEVHRYLHGLHVPLDAVRAALHRGAAAGGPLAHHDGYYMLPGRERLVATRRERAERAARLWPAAVRYGRAIASLPFVRLVAVTGSLAWDNVPADADIDYLVVTSPDRVWVVRWLVALLRRVAGQEGLVISPNHIVSTRALGVPERDLYVAYELAGMTPIAGMGMYRRLRQANAWTVGYLPNAAEAPRRPPVHLVRERRGRDRLFTRLLQWVERLLRSRVGSAVERYEMRYRIGKLHRYYRRVHHAGGNPPVATFGVDAYRAYWGGHRPHALTRFAERVRSLEERMS
jgi:hypothetical protein